LREGPHGQFLLSEESLAEFFRALNGKKAVGIDGAI